MIVLIEEWVSIESNRLIRDPICAKKISDCFGDEQYDLRA